MQSHRRPLGQHVVQLVYRHRYLVTAILILLNLAGLSLARTVPAGKPKGDGKDAPLASYRENAFLLELMDRNIAAVPEPGSAGLLFAGLTVLILKRPKRI